MGKATRQTIPIRSGPKRIRFTKRTLQGLAPPAKGRVYWYDDRSPSLCLCVTHTGARTFYSYRKIDGKPVRLRLGSFPDMSVENARKACEAAAGDIARGQNPHEQKKARREEWSLGDLWDWYLKRHAKPHVKSWREEHGLWKRYLADWAGRRLSDLSRDDVTALHQQIGEQNGRTAANRTVELLCNVFNVASRLSVWSGDNPASGIRKFKLKSRERFLQPHEVPALFKALNEDTNPDIGDFVRLAIFTGARRWNLLSMRFDEIDLQARVWTIPETKSGETVRVPLAPQAVEILERRQAAAGGEYVFPARRQGKYPHMSYPHSAWWRVCKRAGLTDLRLHDLRRTLGSWQAAGGASEYIIGKSLGHRSTAATAIYARLNLDPVRASVETAVAALEEAGKDGQ
ncbi:MAG: tyrosine-type recombinase/integrase [Maioricimonas sp. JB049]